VNPTRARDLWLVGAVALALAFLLMLALYDDLPPLPYTFGATVGVLAVAEALLAPSVKARLEGRPRTRPILPIAVARTAALAKASSVLGALGAGAWLGVAGYLLTRLELRAARPDLARALVTAVLSGLLVVAALRLESVCRRRDLPDERTGEGPGGSPRT
jgi:hypothetical protein